MSRVKAILSIAIFFRNFLKFNTCAFQDINSYSVNNIQDSTFAF